MSVSLLTIGVVAVCGIVLVLICNTNRGLLIPIRGVPWIVPFVLIVIMLYTALMGRTKLGRYLYAIGNNPEAARRAGINVPLIRTIGFTLGGMTAALGGHRLPVDAGQRVRRHPRRQPGAVRASRRR